MNQQKSSKKKVFVLITIIILACFAEAASYLGLRFLQYAGVVQQPYPITRAAYAKYLSQRHSLLGWPSSTQPRVFIYKGRSGLISSDNTTSADLAPLVSIYGDSFALGHQSHTRKWASVLAGRLDRTVLLFAQGGYGTDQALLNFLDHNTRLADDPAPIAILGVCTENIMRNINQYRQFLYQCDSLFTLKPRYALDPSGKDLQLIPMPDLSYEQFVEMQTAPEKYLSSECFLPGTRWGMAKMRFPFTFSLAHTLATQIHVRSVVKGNPWHAEYYDWHHPCQPMPVTVGIIDEFIRSARKMGKVPLVLVLPTKRDFDYYRAHHAWVHAPLIQYLEKEKIPFCDFGPYLEPRMEGKPAEKFFFQHHYDGEAEALLGQQVEEYIRENHATLISR